MQMIDFLSKMGIGQTLNSIDTIFVAGMQGLENLHQAICWQVRQIGVCPDENKRRLWSVVSKTSLSSVQYLISNVFFSFVWI